MCKKIEAVELYCENLDWIRIPSCYVENIEILNVETDAELLANHEAELVFILNKTANIEAATFEEDMHCLNTGENTLFERLQNPDLTEVTIHYTDQTSVNYLVLWEDVEGNEYINRYQTASIQEDGSLIVKICKEM